MHEKISRVEKILGRPFNQRELLERALTHGSHAYENQPEEPQDNENLEFLGDSVIGLIVADFFYSTHPELSEGELSKLKSTAVSTLALSQLARRVHLDKYILLGKGEERSGGRKKNTILAGVFEAVVGALYLDGGLEAARQFLLGLLESSFKKIKGERFFINNYKSALQEYFQKENLPAPGYELLTEKGPDHKKSFVVEVSFGQKALAKAKGHSIKNAEQNAAQKALKRLLGKRMKALSPETFILKKQ
jgi:ribonuclease-3